MQTAWPYPIGKHKNRCIQIYFHLASKFCFTTRTHDIGLSNSMVQHMKLRCSVFNKVFLVNHWHDIHNCSCKWLCFSNSHRCIGLKPQLLLPFKCFVTAALSEKQEIPKLLYVIIKLSFLCILYQQNTSWVKI